MSENQQYFFFEEPESLGDFEESSQEIPVETLHEDSGSSKDDNGFLPSDFQPLPLEEIHWDPEESHLFPQAEVAEEAAFRHDERPQLRLLFIPASFTAEASQEDHRDLEALSLSEVISRED